MTIHNVLASNAVRTAAGTAAVAIARTATAGSIEVPGWFYTIIAVLLALIGVVLARFVTITDENKRLGRKQLWQETWPLTFIGVLIVCPFIWHFQIDIPYASLIGLGVGYSVRLFLKILGAGALSAARALAKQAAEELAQSEAEPKADAEKSSWPEAMVLPADRPDAGIQRLEEKLRKIPSSRPLPSPPENE